MSKNHFLELFRKELSYLQEKGKKFSERHPHLASHLDISHIPSEDPHISRLIESVAFINAMVQGNIDEDYSHVLKSLNGIAFPDSQAPLPSVALIRWEPDTPHTAPLTLPRKTIFAHDKQVFSSLFDITIPHFHFGKPQYLSFAEAHFPRIPSKNLEECISIPLEFPSEMEKIEIFQSELVFYISSDLHSSSLMFERLLTKCEYIAIHEDKKCIQVLDRSSLFPYGYDIHQQMLLQNDKESFWIQSLFLEYFHCPEKLMFLKLKGLSFLPKKDSKYTLGFYAKNFDFNSLAHVEFSCHIIPLVNRFFVTGLAVRYSAKETIISLLAPSPDGKYVTEYHAIESVTVLLKNGENIKLPGYFDNTHRFESRQAYWKFCTEKSLAEDELDKCEIEIFDPENIIADGSFISIDGWASHRQFMKRTPLPVGSLLKNKNGKGRVIIPITPQRFMSKGKTPELMYCSHLEIQDFFGENGVAKMERILHLHDSKQTFATRKIAKIISDLKLKIEYGSVLIGRDRAFLCGTGIHLYLNYEEYQDVIIWPLVCIMEEFFAFSAHLNTYIRLYVYKDQEKTPFYTSPRRHGKRSIV